MPFTELEVQTWTLYTTVVITLVGFFLTLYPFIVQSEPRKIWLGHM